MSTTTFVKTDPPDWLLAFWREINEKTWDECFDCFVVWTGLFVHRSGVLPPMLLGGRW